MMRVGITGASGLIGQELTRALHERGDLPLPLPRSRHRRPDEVASLDAVVNLAGAPVSQRWTPEVKAEIRASRVIGTRSLAEAIEASGREVRVVSASAVGYYGDRGDEVLREDSAPGTGFLADVCRDWEAVAPAGAAVIRTGIVLVGSGGALAKQLPLFRLGLGGPLGSGRQFWPWISLHDHVRAVLFLLDNPQITGPVNLSAPEPLPQKDVARALGKALHRPAVVPVPGFALRLVLGGFASELLGGQRSVPAVLEREGFGFDHPDIASALAWALR